MLKIHLIALVFLCDTLKQTNLFNCPLPNKKILFSKGFSEGYENLKTFVCFGQWWNRNILIYQKFIVLG